MKFKTLPHKIHKIHGRKFSTILNLMTSILFKIPNTEVFQNTLCYVGVSFLCKYAKHMFRLPSGNWTLAQSILFSLLLLEHSRIQMKNLKPVLSQSSQALWHCNQGKEDREGKNWENKRKKSFFLRKKRWGRTQSPASRQKAGRAPNLVPRL